MISFIDEVDVYKNTYEDFGESYSEYMPLVHELNPNNFHVVNMVRLLITIVLLISPSFAYIIF